MSKVYIIKFLCVADAAVFGVSMHAGLKRTGKSCRLRWLNYLRPDVKRGDFTADEQLLILDLHSRWGNRYYFILLYFIPAASFDFLLSCARG